MSGDGKQEHDPKDAGTGQASRTALGLVATGTVAALMVAGVPAPTSALDLDSDGGLITETVAGRERLGVYDQAKKFGAERVSERDRAHLMPEGFRAGNYIVLPSIGAAVVYDDNIFGTDLDRHADIRSEITPGIRFQSQLPRHVLDLSVGGKIVNYRENPEQDYASVQAKLDGALHFDHAHTLSISTLSALEHEERSDALLPTTAGEPVAIVHNRAAIGITRDVGRLYGTLSASFDRWDFNDATTSSSARLEQDQRDLDLMAAQVKFGYRISPGYELVGKVRALQQWNRGNTLTDYDGIGYEAMAGVAFETNPLVRWRLLGGYGIRDYELATIKDVATSLLEGQVQWLATQRMTLYGTATRAVEDRVGTDVGGRIESRLHGKLEYEIQNNLLLTVDGELRDSDFIGVTRRDRGWSARVGLDYYHTKNWLFTFGYEHQVRDSTEDAFDVTRNRFSVGAKFRY